MVLLQYVQGETHKQVVNRIQKSRGLNTVSRQKRRDMCQTTSSETNFQSLSTGTDDRETKKLPAHRGETGKKHSELDLTPRFSSAFSEQIHSDLDCSAFTKDLNGGHKMNQKTRSRWG
jgi:hypothetical protein